MGENWKSLLAGSFIGAVIVCALVVASIVSHRYEIERMKIIQQEKSERGHWIWGHATDWMKEGGE